MSVVVHQGFGGYVLLGSNVFYSLARRSNDELHIIGGLWYTYDQNGFGFFRRIRLSKGWQSAKFGQQILIGDFVVTVQIKVFNQLDQLTITLSNLKAQLEEVTRNQQKQQDLLQKQREEDNERVNKFREAEKTVPVRAKQSLKLITENALTLRNSQEKISK